MGAVAAGWLADVPEGRVAPLLLVCVLAMVLLGGMRSLSWSGAAAAIVALIAVLVPVAIVAGMVTNLPLPQLSHGPVLRAIGRMEAIQGVPVPIAPSMALELAGIGLEPLTHRIAQPYASVGPVAFILMTLTVMCGIAAAPWLLPRTGTVPGVYEARKANGWALVFAGILMLTAASVAVFMRDMAMQQLATLSPDRLPDWFKQLQAMGLASVDGNMARLPLTSFSFKRDGVLFALPIAAGFPAVMLHLALAGAIAAALLGAAASMLAIGFLVAEDAVGGLVSEAPPEPLRLNLVRGATAVAALLVGWMAVFIRFDPLDLMLWALALSASTAFPVVVLSIWWKRLNAVGAIAGLITGFVVAVLAILAGEAALLGVPGRLAAVLGMPAAFLTAILATRLGPVPGRHVLEVVRDMRLPGGETVHDRDVRLQRLKRRRGP